MSTFLENNKLSHDHLKKILEDGINYKLQKKVINKTQPEKDHVSFSAAPNSGMSLEELEKLYQDVMEKSTNFSSPRFVGFPDAGNSIAGISSSIMSVFLNQNLINQNFCSPEATFIEMETIHWLRQLAGYKTPERYNMASDISGVSAHGGVLANCIALLAARERAFPGTMNNGLKEDPTKIKIMVPEGIGHYSIRASLSWLGIGESNLVSVPITKDYKTDLNKLELKIKAERDKGNYVMAYVAYAGDSRTMSVDDMEGIAAVLNKYKIWFHIDACHGFQLLFSEKEKYKMKGCQYADSITIDPHKILWLPYVCSFVLFKELSSLKNICTASDLITKEKWSLGQTTPFIGSKAFNSFKLWSLIKHQGVDAIGNLIDKRLGLTKKIRELIGKDDCFHLLNETDINSCMFIYLPKEMRKKSYIDLKSLTLLNEINLEVKNTVLAEGEFYIHGFPINSSGFTKLFSDGISIQVLRTMNGNDLTSIEDIQALLTRIKAIGDKISSVLFSGAGAGNAALESDLFIEFRSWVRSFLEGEKYFCIIYGSSAFEKTLFESDIDVMIFVDDAFVTEKNIEIATKKVIELHRKYNLPIDEEVPFAKKLLVPFSFLESVLVGRGFKPEGVKLIVPDIIKSEEFLASKDLLARLCLNVMTTKSILLSGEFDTFYSFREMATEFIIALMLMNYNWIESFDDLVDKLYSDGTREGELYLGYKKGTELNFHLTKIVQTVGKKMLERGQLIAFNNGIALSQAYQLKLLNAHKSLIDNERA